MTQPRRHYGSTWNDNPAGRLWEKRWYLHADGSGSAELSASGVFVPPTLYTDRPALEAAFADELAKFAGGRAVTSGAR